VFAKNAVPVKKEAQLDEAFVDERKRVKQGPEKRGADAVATFEDNVDGELLETLSALRHGKSEDGESRIEDG
jgi:hypothetical protein